MGVRTNGYYTNGDSYHSLIPSKLIILLSKRKKEHSCCEYNVCSNSCDPLGRLPIVPIPRFNTVKAKQRIRKWLVELGTLLQYSNYSYATEIIR